MSDVYQEWHHISTPNATEYSITTIAKVFNVQVYLNADLDMDIKL